MQNTGAEVHRIVLAITETASLQDLWQVVKENMAGRPAELVTIFVSDDRWLRAASLPFTMEISGFTGARSNFTPSRAEQIGNEAVSRTQDRLKQLATEAKLDFIFEIMAEQDVTRIHELVPSESDMLIAPSFFKLRPIYNELARLRCRILLVDTQDVTTARSKK